MSKDTVQINRPLHTKKQNEFLVEFYGMPENIGNILGRQVKSFELPTMMFNRSEHFHRGKKQNFSDTMEFEDINITFRDDEGNLTLRALYSQIRRQYKFQGPRADKNFKFDIGVKAFSTTGDLIHEMVMKNCLLISVAHTEMLPTASDEMELQATFSIDDVDLKQGFFDE